MKQMENSKDDERGDREENANKRWNPSAVVTALLCASRGKINYCFALIIFGFHHCFWKQRWQQKKKNGKKRYTLPFTFSIHSHQSMLICNLWNVIRFIRSLSYFFFPELSTICNGGPITFPIPPAHRRRGKKVVHIYSILNWIVRKQALIHPSQTRSKLNAMHFTIKARKLLKRAAVWCHYFALNCKRRITVW